MFSTNVSIADFNIRINSEDDLSLIFKSCYKDDSFDFEIDIRQSDIEKKKSEMLTATDINYSKYVAMLFILQEKITVNLPYYKAFLLHSACFDVNGDGVVFAALSGTGKTTHMLNWHRYLNGNDKIYSDSFGVSGRTTTGNARKNVMTVVNGDKPFVRFFDDSPFPVAYGTPWAGKENFCTETKTTIKHICFIERSDTNFVTKLTALEALPRIMNQVYMPKEPIALANTLTLIDKFISNCSLWVIHCNEKPESAAISYKAIFGN